MNNLCLNINITDFAVIFLETDLKSCDNNDKNDKIIKKWSFSIIRNEKEENLLGYKNKQSNCNSFCSNLLKKFLIKK